MRYYNIDEIKRYTAEELLEAMRICISNMEYAKLHMGRSQEADEYRQGLKKHAHAIAKEIATRKNRKFRVMLDEGAKMPTKAHNADAGFDLYAPRAFTVLRGASTIIDTGVHIEIPKGYVGFLKSKSGLNVKYGITGEGVIDAGYTGSIVAKLYNNGSNPVRFEEGQKIIQIVFLPIPEVELVLTDSFEKTERGDNGFGSSGEF
jgi:dUTP pyrophosphatase